MNLRNSLNGEEQELGWIKGQYDLSWQVLMVLGELLNDHDPEKSQRVMNTMLQMVKPDIEKLK